MKKGFKILNICALLLFMSLSSAYAGNEDEVVIGKYVKLYSKAMDEERTMIISVPDDYDHSSEKYPVLYVLDGSVQTMIEAKADVQMAKYCYSPEMIIVAIVNNDRNRDMMPGTDAAPNFLRFITEELFDYMKKEYRVDENQRILYGGSNAGLFTMFAFLTNPDNFTGYISSSPTICHRKQIMMDMVQNMIKKDVKLNKFMYVIYGDVDFPEVTDTLAVFLPWLRELGQKGLRLKVDYLPEDGHIPYGSLQYGLMAMYEGYAYPPEKLETQGLDSMKAYYGRYSKRVGYVQNPPKQKILFFGQEMLRQNKVKEAVDAFEYALKLYPDDYTGTLLLAVAHFKDNEMDQARKEYFLTKEKMKMLNEKSDPPVDEWKELKKKFDS